MYKELLLSNSKAGVPLPPGAEVFNVLVAKKAVTIGYSIDIPNSSIQPNTFMGIKIEDFTVSSLLGEKTWLNLQNRQPVQHVMVIRLDTGLRLKLEKYLLGYSSNQLIFSDEDVGKTIKIALVAN